MGFWNNVSRLNLQDFRPGIRSVAEFGDRLVMACMEIGPGKEDAGHQHPFEQCGVVVEGRIEMFIGDERRVLEAMGYRVGITAQPDWRHVESLHTMGPPRLFVGVTAGNLDSMLSNYTAARHKRKEDAYSERGVPGRRPNHAAVVYSQMAKQAFPGVPVVLGGVEASMRRVAHYDYWEDKLRPSILADAKADLLVYGMGETAVREIAQRLAAGRADLGGILGTALLLGAKATAAATRRRSTPPTGGLPPKASRQMKAAPTNTTRPA